MNFVSIFTTILSPSERRYAIGMLVVTLVMGILDTAGVASIMPFVALLANPELIETNHYLKQLYTLSGASSSQDFLFLIGGVTFFVLVISLSFKALAMFVQQRFSLLLEYQISSRLVEGYLYQKYTWFLGRNSSDLGKTILSEVGTVVGGGVMPIISIITNSILTVMLVGLLIAVDPQSATVIAVIFVLSYGLIYLTMRGFLGELGSQRVIANQRRFEVISEAFGAIKEVKACSLESRYIERFKSPALIFAKHRAISRIVAMLPRYALEIMAFGGILVVVLLLLGRGEPLHKTLPLLTLYAFAGYRLMPAAQHIYSSLTSLSFARAAIRDLCFELNSLPQSPIGLDNAPLLGFQHSLLFENVTYKYPTGAGPTIENLDLVIPARTFFGFVGPTGGGKTTIIDLVLGLLEPDHGSILVDGVNMTALDLRKWQEIIGYVPQKVFLADATISENIAFSSEPSEIDITLVERVAKIAQIHDFVINETLEGYKTQVGEGGARLSGGQRQRIGIARALYRNPKILVLDEATSALDNVTEMKVIEAIQKVGEGITVVIIAHRLNTVRLCDHLAFVEKGKVSAVGTYDSLVKNNKNFRAFSNATVKKGKLS